MGVLELQECSKKIRDNLELSVSQIKVVDVV